MKFNGVPADHAGKGGLLYLSYLGEQAQNGELTITIHHSCIVYALSKDHTTPQGK